MLAVGLISAGTLSFEILLVRVFAIQHFHHFAYMAIGVAMLGFGASGTALALARSISSETATKLASWCSVGAAASLFLAPAIAFRIPLDPTQLPWDTGQWYRLAAVYLALALPFSAGAMVVLLAVAAAARHPGLVYGASFAGSGLGVAAAIAGLWLVVPERALALPAVLAAVGGLAATSRHENHEKGAAADVRARLAAAAIAFLAVLCVARPPWSVEVSPYKELPQVEAHPGAHRLAERSNPVGWVVAVEAPSLRHAPGLSLGFGGTLPHQIGLFLDGQVAGAVGTAAESQIVADWLPTAAPYGVREIHSVLIPGVGGGSEILNALAHGADRITGVELHSGIAELAQSLSEVGTFPSSVSWIVGDARRFAATTTDRYDLVTMPPSGAMGASAAGLHSLSEDFLHTTDAYVSYLKLLNEQGLLAVTCWLTVPPRKSARSVLTMAEALRLTAPANVRRGIVVMRSWGTATVLAKPTGFSQEEIASLRDWAARRLFDLDWYPGIEAPDTRFHHVEEPVLFNAARAASVGPVAAARFAASYPFDIAPVSDARPYPDHFLHLGSLGSLFGPERGSLLPFAEWGQIALAATLAQSLVLASLLMIVPAALTRRQQRGPHWLALVGYFSAIGFAYLAAEIAAIQQLGLLLGHPVYAVATVLAAFLIGSGVGSMVSDRVAVERVWMVGVIITALLLACAAAMLHVVHELQGANVAVRASVALAVLVPLALLMGMPFPLGLRKFTRGHQQGVAWAWAANGFASVVAAPLAALIALELGSPILFAGAAVAYAAASGLAVTPGRVTEEALAANHPPHDRG